jgi:hypothetical protein
MVDGARHAYDAIMRFPRAVRLDESDARLYERLAVPGEWAVCGAFVFVDADLDALSGGEREAFRHGFLGTVSHGWTTLVAVDEIGEDEYRAVVERLADHLLRHYDAPDRDAAVAAARAEAEFAASLCRHELHTMLSVERGVEGDTVVENFRIARPAVGVDHSRVRLWGVETESS